MSAVDSKIIFYPKIHLIIWFELARFEFTIIFAAGAEVAAATLEYHFDCGIDLSKSYLMLAAGLATHGAISILRFGTFKANSLSACCLLHYLNYYQATRCFRL